MVETKEDFWNKMNDIGEQDRKIALVLDQLKNEFNQDKNKDIFNEKAKFTEEFLLETNNILDKTLSQFSNLSKVDSDLRKETFILELEQELDIHINKEAYGEIVFDSFLLLQFFKPFSPEIDELVFTVKEDGIHINSMDSKRISIFEIFLKNDSFKF